MAMPEFSSSPRTETLADPELRAALLRFVARRLNEIDAEDVVQATLTEAFASPKAPAAPEELRRWYQLNPFAGLMEGFRTIALQGRMPGLTALLPAVAWAVVLLALGALCFRAQEATLADYV